MRPKILLIDDDASFREVMCFHLKDAGIEVDAAASGAEGLRLFEAHHHPIVVTDLRMPGVSGLDVLRTVRARVPDTLVLVMTAFADVSTAVDAMKAGAIDFLPKPCDRDHLRLTLERALERVALQAEVRDLQDRLNSGGKELVYRSEVMERLVAIADRIARSDATVLLFGESGTGKELVARRIHRSSPRSSEPFVPINCGAIPRELLESELFGHAKGAFTGAHRDRRGRFEQANGGTLFLDEIGELPMDMQTRLLRVLQEREVVPVGKDTAVPVDVRVIAATNRDLRKSVDSGAFREDLYYRLAVVPLEVPALRERRDDIPALVEHFLRRHGGDRQLTASPGLLRRFVAREWRGNVRELENTCQRVALLAEDDVLEEALLDASPAPPGNAAPEHQGIQLPPEGISLVDIERDVILRALEMNHWNQAQTARFLRIPRHILLYRIEKHQIPVRGRS